MQEERGTALNLGWSAGHPDDEVTGRELVLEELQHGIISMSDTEDPVSRQAEKGSPPGGWT